MVDLDTPLSGIRFTVGSSLFDKFGLMALALFSLLSPQLYSQQLVENVLVTGSHSPLSELTASNSVLDQQQIRRLNKRSLAEVLQTVPGLLVEQQGGPGGLTAVSIRGAEANFTLVLLDGVAVNDPTNTRGGGFDFANLNPSLVERIEIVRGAQSSVYGSDALAGVINIVTRRPEQGHAAELSVEWGQHGFADYTFGAQGAAASWDYSLGIAHRDDGEPVEGSSRDADNATLRLGWSPAKGQRVEIGVRYLEGKRSSYPEQGGGPRFSVTPALDASEYRDEVYSLSWQAAVSDLWTSKLTVDRFSHQDDYTSPGISPYFEVPPNGADTEFERDQVQWTNTLTFSDVTELNIGAHYRDEEGVSEGYLDFFGALLPTDFKLGRRTSGVFANLSTSPLNGVLLQSSVRFDAPDGFDSETTFSLGGRYRLTDAVSISANWGEAFKVPSFFALGHPLVGNPDLKPEMATSWDLGVSWHPNNRFHLAATAFVNDYEDLVDFDNETFRNVNRNTVESRGVELESRWQLRPELFLSGQLTYTDVDLAGQDTVLTGRPEWLAALSANWQVTPKWHTVLDYRYTGQQWAASRHSGMEETSQLDDFHRMDWSLQFSPAEHWSLNVTVDNLLDENYQTAIGFPAPSRGVRIGFRYSL